MRPSPIAILLLALAAKLGFGYGNVDLDRFGVRGRTNIFLWRLQWVH